MSTTENLLYKRTSMLVFAVIGFTLWQGALLVSDVSSLPGEVTNPFQAMGMIVWGLAMLRLAQLSHAMNNRDVADLLNDELTQLQRSKSFTVAYFVMTGLIAFTLTTSIFLDLDPVIIVRGLLLAAVITPLVAFLWLDHKAGQEPR